jgi:hypothetical protein
MLASINGGIVLAHLIPPVAEPPSLAAAEASRKLHLAQNSACNGDLMGCQIPTSPTATINRDLANEGAALVLVMIAEAGRRS